MIEKSLLVSLALLPLAGLPLVLLFPNVARWVTLAISLVGLLLGGWIFLGFDPLLNSPFSARFALDWVPRFGIRFALGIDGLSLPLILLAKATLPIAVFASWSERRREGLMMACYLLADSLVSTCLLASDLFLFYTCYEFMLLPLLLLIGIWGGTQRVAASFKFFLFTAAGSFMMLAALIWVVNAYHTQWGSYSTDIFSLYQLKWPGRSLFAGVRPELLCFIAFGVAFAVKVPLLPFHAWLPISYKEAPTGGTIYLSALLSKLGIYGFLRLAIPLCPSAFAETSSILAFLGAAGCLYGAILAFQQTNLKLLLSYSSFSHLGLIVVGVATVNKISWNGVLLHVFNHGINSAMLFLLAGMLYERRQSYELSDLGGLAQRMPRYAFFLSLAAFSSMALPGLSGFAGEFLILLGTFEKMPILAGFLVLSTILSALYLLRLIQKTLLGDLVSPGNRTLKDLSGKDCVPLVCLAFLLISLGVEPFLLAKKVESFTPSTISLKGE